MMQNAILKDALRWASRREYLGKNMTVCPKCLTAQVQLIDHFNVPAEWKCRRCHHKFSHEPVIHAH